MKRTYKIAAALAALGVLGALGNYLWAQPGQPNYPPQPGSPQAAPVYQQPQAAAQPQASAPRVAVINMFVVFKGYQKWDFYRKELQNTAKQYEQADTWYKAEMTKESNKMKDPGTTPAQRDDSTNKIKEYQRKIEDNAAAYSKVMSEKGDLQVQQLFHEVEDAVKSYARANGIHLVLNYTDLVGQPDLYSGRNITRKLIASGQAGACSPLYAAPGMDISDAVVSMLNSRYPAASTTGAPGATGVVPAGNPGGNPGAIQPAGVQR